MTEPQMPRLISSPEQLRENHSTYNLEMTRKDHSTIAALVDVIPYNRSWIAVRNATGAFTFAPSKFVGYRGMTAEIFQRFTRNGLDGRETEPVIQQWVTRLYAGDSDYEAAHDQLFAFCSKFGKKPNAGCRISVLLDMEMPTQLNNDNVIADAVLKLYRILPPNLQEEVVRRING